MPGDRLALTIRVGGEIQGIGFFQRPGDRIHVALVSVDDLVIHRKAAGRVHRAFLWHQVPDMAIGCEDNKVLAQILLQGLRLCRRLDDD